MMRQMLFLLLLSSSLWAQGAGAQLSPSAQGGQSQADTAGQAATRPSPGEAGDDLAQMRTDLNHMESLLNNMSSEITFLRDQNLQILLNSNARMWTILIRDLRLQIDREQQRRTGKKTPSAAERQVPQVKPPLFLGFQNRSGSRSRVCSRTVCTPNCDGSSGSRGFGFASQPSWFDCSRGNLTLALSSSYDRREER